MWQISQLLMLTVILSNKQIYSALNSKPPYDKRSGPLFHGEPWDGHLQGTLPPNRDWCRRDLKAADWLQIMDKYNMELAFLYSTGAGDVSRVREPGYALALSSRLQ